MAAKIMLEMSAGSLEGLRIRSDGGVTLCNGRILIATQHHGVFYIGRGEDCHIRFPDNDLQISRHHFILETDPPDVRIRDIGSMYGTHVLHAAGSGWDEIGRRLNGETPERGESRSCQNVNLADGDQIRIGQTIISIRMKIICVCVQCGLEVTEGDRAACAWLGANFLCSACRLRLATGALLSQMLGQAGLISEGMARPEIPGYEILDPIGRSRYGTVYFARRKKDGSRFAIKVMHPRLSEGGKAREDFLRGMEITKALQEHPNIVALQEYGEAGSSLYFLMNYYPEGSMAELTRRRGGCIPVAEAGPLMLQTLDGLIFLHALNIVHHNLKPANILLECKGGILVPKLSDLGLAKDFLKAKFIGHALKGEYAGPFPFMPREQLADLKFAMPISDIWSMGATFYSMLTGALPHDLPPEHDLANLVFQQSHVPLGQRNPSIPRKLAEAIDRALAAEPGDRHQTAVEMKRTIEDALE